MCYRITLSIKCLRFVGDRDAETVTKHIASPDTTTFVRMIHEAIQGLIQVDFDNWQEHVLDLRTSKNREVQWSELTDARWLQRNAENKNKTLFVKLLTTSLPTDSVTGRGAMPLKSEYNPYSFAYQMPPQFPFAMPTNIPRMPMPQIPRPDSYMVNGTQAYTVYIPISHYNSIKSEIDAIIDRYSSPISPQIPPFPEMPQSTAASNNSDYY